MIKTHEVYCDKCARFIRPARKRTKENPFNFEREGPHFCSHQCAKAYYDEIILTSNDRGKR